MAAIGYLVLATCGAGLVVLAAADPSWLTGPSLLLGWFLADLATGVVHMTFDYLPCPRGKGLDTLFFYVGPRDSTEYLAIRREVMGRISAFEKVVFDFKTHHPRPRALGRRTLHQQIASTVAYGTAPASVVLLAVCAGLGLPGWCAAACASLLLGTTFAQYFHGTLHRDENPWFVRAMRRVHLLMTPERHQLHHDSLRRDFATNCGFSNALLNPVFASLHRRGLLRDEGLEPTG